MKNLFKSMMLVAVAAMGFTACSKDAAELVNPANEGTYTMTFVADAPNTRTSVAIDGDVATYSWSEGDKVGFYKVANGIESTVDKYREKAGSDVAVIADNGSATFKVTLNAAEGASTYNIGAFYPSNSWAGHAEENLFNNVNVKIGAAQTLTANTFDPTADLMMAKPFMGVALDNEAKTLEFTRIAAVGKMNLKLTDMVEGEVIESVTFTLADGTHFNGPVTLDLENSTYTLGTTGTSNKVTITGELAADADRTPIFFTCFPGEYSGAYSIDVTTDKATYSKTGELSKALSFTAGDVLSFNATVGNRVEEVIEAGTIVDVLNLEFTEVSGSSYTEWSDKTDESDAVYAGQSAGGNSSIQLRSSNSKSGIVTTTSGGYAKKVVVTWNNNTSSGRTLQVYGKNTAYKAATDLYESTVQGTLLGTIVMGTSTELVIDGDYEYIGLRSKENAMFLTQIEITWGGGDTRTKLATPKVTATAEGKNVIVSWGEVANAGSYTLTYGDQTIENATSPYTFEGEYSTTYDFSVVAVPTDSENYKDSAAGTASVTTEADPNAEETTVEMNIFANKGTTGTNTISWTSGIVTVTNNKASSTTNIRTSDSDHHRVYANSKLVISVASGTISKVVITVAGSEYVSPMETSFKNAGYTVSTSGTTVTVTGNASAFTMTASAQTRLSKVAVTYAN